MEGIPLTLKDLVNPPPMMPWREFANWIRMSEDHDTVRGWMRNGYLPLLKGRPPRNGQRRLADQEAYGRGMVE